MNQTFLPAIIQEGTLSHITFQTHRIHIKRRAVFLDHPPIILDVRTPHSSDRTCQPDIALRPRSQIVLLESHDNIIRAHCKGYFHGLVQYYNNPGALEMELMQSSTEPQIWLKCNNVPVLDHTRNDAVHIASILAKSVVLWHQDGADKQQNLKFLWNTLRGS